MTIFKSVAAIFALYLLIHAAGSSVSPIPIPQQCSEGQHAVWSATPTGGRWICGDAIPLTCTQGQTAKWDSANGGHWICSDFPAVPAVGLFLTTCPTGYTQVAALNGNAFDPHVSVRVCFCKKD